MTSTVSLATGFQVLEENASVIDRAIRHLRFFFGEDFFRPLAGVPYYDSVLDKYGLDRLVDVIRTEVLKVRDVTDATVTIVEVTNNRVAEVQVTLQSRFGTDSFTLGI